MIIWRMRIACWIPNATNTHSECVILIVFPQQQFSMNAPHGHVTCTLPVLLISFSLHRVCNRGAVRSVRFMTCFPAGHNNAILAAHLLRAFPLTLGSPGNHCDLSAEEFRALCLSYTSPSSFVSGCHL
jgi:hypothetical protein